MTTTIPPRYTQAAIDSIQSDIRITSKARADYDQWLAAKQAELATVEEGRKFWTTVDGLMRDDGFVRNQYEVKTADGKQPAFSGYFRKADRKFVSNEQAATAYLEKSK